ncbi:phage tail spike protein [Lactococcus lactis subsp. lactis]|uniref:phage tail spike protein n=1 Tax=Lactococcus lactis TaxID=1358 RepID=UPI00311FF5E0
MVKGNIQWYFDQLGLINFAKISLGINQVENYTRTINYDSEDTKLARLISVIQNFDAEFEFVTKLKRDGTLDNITLNIYKKNDGGDIQGVGQNRNDVLLSFGENVTGVNRKVEKSQIFNSLYVTGKDGLSWKDSAWSVTNSEGQEEFYKRASESYAKAPLSAQMFPSQLQSSSGDIFTNKNVATEYTTVNAMWGYALSQLKQYAYPLITYEVTATSNLTVSSTGDGMPLHIGDTVRIQDKNFIDSDGNVGLFLSARVSELEISFTNPTSNKITFSNYIKLKSEVSDDLTARMQEIINANTPYRPDITSTNGLQFKNGTGTTTLGAHIYFGSDTTETVADSYEWSKDGTVVANVQEITVDASGVANKAVYSFKATVAGKAVASQSVTITNVNDGTNGRSVTNVSQRWRLTTTSTTPTQGWSDAGWLTTQPTTTAINKYLWSITRTTFNLAPLTQDVIEQKAVYGDKGGDGIPGKDGVGLKTTVITYAISTSGTTAPTTGWTSSVPSLAKGQYLWTKTVWTYTDNSTETGYSVTYISKDGNDGDDGFPGKDGVGIKTTTITYAGSTSGTTAPTSGWTATVPAVAAGSYLWTKTVWAYTDNTSETGYSVAKMGNTGADGKDGKTAINLLPNSTWNLGQGTWTEGFANRFEILPPASDKPNSAILHGLPTTSGTQQLSNLPHPIFVNAGVTYSLKFDYKDKNWTKSFNLIALRVFPEKTTGNSQANSSWYDYVTSSKLGVSGTTANFTSFTYSFVPTSSGYLDVIPYDNDTTGNHEGWYRELVVIGGTIAQLPETWLPFVGDLKGEDGDPGEVVSDTEPTTRFKGLTWKYSGTTDLTASDGTVIKPNTEYYFNGKNWMINFLSANNIGVNSITAEKINGTDLEVKNGKFTDGVIETSWKNGTVAGSTNIEKDHLIITRTDSSVNTTNSIGLDSTQGLIMVYTENSTGRTISVGTNFQGMSLSDSTGISASISPAGVKLSSDVNWTQIGNIGGRRAEWKRENNRVTMNIHGGNGDGFPVITSGGTLLGMLPTNARPPSDISMPATAQGAGATAQISINSTGEVRCYRWGGDSVYFGAYISYYVE